MPVTPKGDRLAGQGEMGGVWEWTSTPLSAHEGFEEMKIYPGYSGASILIVKLTYKANINLAL